MRSIDPHRFNISSSSCYHEYHKSFVSVIFICCQHKSLVLFRQGFAFQCRSFAMCRRIQANFLPLLSRHLMSAQTIPFFGESSRCQCKIRTCSALRYSLSSPAQINARRSLHSIPYCQHVPEGTRFAFKRLIGTKASSFLFYCQHKRSKSRFNLSTLCIFLLSCQEALII